MDRNWNRTDNETNDRRIFLSMQERFLDLILVPGFAWNGKYRVAFVSGLFIDGFVLEEY